MLINSSKVCLVQASAVFFVGLLFQIINTTLLFLQEIRKRLIIAETNGYSIQ